MLRVIRCFAMEETVTTAESLQRIDDRLLAIETQLAARGALIDVTQAISDNLDSFGLITQLVDIYKTQRDERQKQADSIIQRLTAIEAALGSDEIRRAFADVFNTLGIVVQLKHVSSAQRDSLAMLVGLAAQLLQEAQIENKVDAEEREDIRALLVHLRENGRKLVAGLADVAHEVERQGEA